MKNNQETKVTATLTSAQVQEEAKVIVTFLEKTAELVNTQYSNISTAKKAGALKNELSGVLDSLEQDQNSPRDIINSLKGDLDNYIKVIEDKQEAYRSELDGYHLSDQSIKEGRKILEANNVGALLKDTASTIKKQVEGGAMAKFYETAGNCFKNLGMTSAAQYCYKQEQQLTLESIKRTLRKDSIIGQNNKYIKTFPAAKTSQPEGSRGK